MLTRQTRSATLVGVNREEILHDLLCSLFDATDLRRFLRFGEDGDRVERQLPGHTASLAELADKAVSVLVQRGLVAAIWERLRAEFPNRRTDIDRVAALWPDDDSGTTSSEEHSKARSAQGPSASTLSPRARELLAEMLRMEASGRRYTVPDDFVRVSKAKSPEEAELHEALRELRDAGHIRGDGPWRPGKVAALTDNGRAVARHLTTQSAMPDTPAVGVLMRARLTISVTLATGFSRQSLLARVSGIRTPSPHVLHHEPEVRTEGLRWAGPDGWALEIGLDGRITYAADLTAPATLLKNQPNGDSETETKPGISVFALLHRLLWVLRVAEELSEPRATVTTMVSLAGIEGRILSFDEMDATLRPNERTWHFRFWNHDARPCTEPTIRSKPHLLPETTRQDICLAIFEDLAAFFLFRTESSLSHPRDALRVLIERIDTLPLLD